MSNFKGLLNGEIKLTIDIILGIIIGELIIKTGITEKIMKKLNPYLTRKNINPITILSLTVSIGSSKTGAAIISSALENNQITEREAIWSILMLPLPSYLKRWPATFALSIGMAGIAGGIFALFLLIRSVARFFVAFFFLKSNSKQKNYNAIFSKETKNFSNKKNKFLLRIIKTLPIAWIFFALTYSFIPFLNNFFKSTFLNHKFFSFLPLSGWAVAAGSVAHVSTALALAGGSLTSGELNNAQAVFALTLGSAFGIISRILRQNASYYFGLFPGQIAGKMLFLNFMTVIPFVLLCLIFAGLALLF